MYKDYERREGRRVKDAVYRLRKCGIIIPKGAIGEWIVPDNYIEIFAQIILSKRVIWSLNNIEALQDMPPYKKMARKFIREEYSENDIRMWAECTVRNMWYVKIYKEQPEDN